MRTKHAEIAEFYRADRQMLHELQLDGSLTHEEVAERIHLSSSNCSRRRHRLERDGVITGYVALVDPAKAGYPESVFLEIRLRSNSRDDIVAFEDAVQRIDEVMDYWALAGHLDYLLRVAVADNQHFQRVHDEKLSRLPGVEHLDTSIALRTVVRKTALPVDAFGTRPPAQRPPAP